MDLSFDPKKDRINQQKHGVSLAEAERIEWDTALEQLDDRADYHEDRYIGLGFIGARLYCVVYVNREDSPRIISLRKANAREVSYYVEANR
ncbi:BrnT family toxin [Massilia sp. BJB1822]|uniref:BrnT family toxin n=1 Tax=Massilia sp. BJB1822 TaxID=2744470 RepID=UPI0015938DEF|nr:BrnT family toxin [Massilia sp. BJB1822]NVE01143.1 BrnT family toxin [Massilia sp. BJB1822]